MSLWNKSGKLPVNFTQEQKRNIIATKHGWTRRVSYTDVHGNVRMKDETLVALGDLNAEVTMGNPDITQIYIANSTGGSTLKAGVAQSAYVVFSEAISIQTGAAYTMAVANTANGAAVTATSSTSKADIGNANNTLKLTFTPTAGTYKINAQALANTTAAKAYSVHGGITETVNTAVSVTVSNTLSTFVVTA